jgi:WD40 repeat protein
LLATGGSTVQLWDLTVAEPKVVRTLQTPANFVAFGPDGQSLVCGLSNGTVELWSLSRSEAKRLLLVQARSKLKGVDVPYVAGMAISANGLGLGTAHGDHTIRLWSLDRDSIAESMVLGPADNPISLAFSSDGQTLASGYSTTPHIYLRNIFHRVSREEITLEGHKHGYVSVAFPPSGDFLASCGWDGTIRLWDPEKKYANLTKTIAVGPTGCALHRLAVTPDGRHIVTANGNGTIYVLRLKEWTAADEKTREE